MQHPGTGIYRLPEIGHVLSGQGIDAINFSAGGNLDETQLREKRALAHEFGVDTDDVLLVKICSDSIGLIDESESGHRQRLTCDD
jgi:hypothetical protein